MLPTRCSPSPPAQLVERLSARFVPSAGQPRPAVAADSGLWNPIGGFLEGAKRHFTHGIEAYAQWLLQQPLAESDQT